MICIDRTSIALSCVVIPASVGKFHSMRLSGGGGGGGGGGGSVWDFVVVVSILCC